MSDPIKQHYLPEVYLKQFKKNPISGESIVYCRDYSNKYDSRIKETGFRNKVFWESHYYSDQRLMDQYAIEKILSSGFESTYDSIIIALSQEGPLDAEIVVRIIGWLWVAKTRSPYYRRRALNFLENLNETHPSALNEFEQKLFNSMKQKNDQTSQKLHTSLFYHSEQIELYKSEFVPGLLNKNWKVLVSKLDDPFITNDNPGFSFSQYPPLTKKTFISPVINVHSTSTNYFVLSPRYCLQISSSIDGIQLSTEDIVVEIPFEEASSELISIINTGTFHTKEKLLISNSKKALKKFTLTF